MNQALVDRYSETDYKLYLIQKNIYRTHHMKPFVFDDSILEVLPGMNKVKVIDSYPDFKFTQFDFSSLTMKDIIKGYYDIISIKHQISESNSESESDIKSIFTDTKWQGNMFKLMLSEITFDKSFFRIMARVQNEIDDLFELYGIELPGIHALEQKLIDLYVKTIEEQRPYLPPIEELAVNDTLYVVNFVHGDVTMKNEMGTYTNEHPPLTVDIPMNFYRIMASEYGAISCISPKESEKYMSIINHFLRKERKNTHRNNTKIIKRIIATLLKKTRDFMNKKKGRIRTTQQRFNQTNPHVHYVKESKIISKNYYVYLTDETTYQINVGNRDFDVNLLHYIDFKINNGVIEFNLADIIKAIEHMKYVLFIDLSCSNSDHMTNKELNNFKSLAKRIEGPSITKEMEMHLNLSPYDTNQSNRSNQSKKLKMRRHSSLTKQSKGSKGSKDSKKMRRFRSL